MRDPAAVTLPAVRRLLPRGARLAGPPVAVLAAALLLAPSAMANFITPKAGESPNANAIHSLYTVILYMAAVVLFLVLGALFYSVFRFRASKGAVAAQIHGNTRLEVGWTVGAALIVVAISVITFAKLPGILNPPNSSVNNFLQASLEAPTPPNGKVLEVCVTGRQFIWRYTYGTGCNGQAWERKLPYSYQEMVAPQGVTVQLIVQSTDVIHSWWVPALGGKVDAVPGFTTYTWFKALRSGYYYGQCAQLCGRQHAFMTALVHVVSPAKYQEWLAAQRLAIAAANDQLTQLRLSLIRGGNLTPGGTF